MVGKAQADPRFLFVASLPCTKVYTNVEHIEYSALFLFVYPQEMPLCKFQYKKSAEDQSHLQEQQYNVRHTLFFFFCI